MAGGNTTALAPGVIRTECDWGYYIDGKKDDLLCSGFAKESWFANGERGCGRMVRTTDTKLEERDALFTEHFNGNCQITVCFTQLEMDDRAAADEVAKAQARMRKRLEAMPKSAEVYRERIIDAVNRFAGAVISVADDASSCGYKFQIETISELQRLACELRNALEIGDVVFDRTARAAVEMEIKMDAQTAHALNDRGYQKLRNKVVSEVNWTGNKALRAEVEALYKAGPDAVQ